jgi:hypothetical protein
LLFLAAVGRFQTKKTQLLGLKGMELMCKVVPDAEGIFFSVIK